jgi:hypothetical protein
VTALDSAAWEISIAGQEMLHSLGLYQHAWSQEPGQPDAEYHDKFDVMGNGGAYAYPNGGYGQDDCKQPGDNCYSGPNLSASYRDVMGWIPSSRKYTYGLHATDPYVTETVTIAGIDLVSSSEPLMVKIPLESGTHYLTVELRLASGWDRALPQPAQVLVKEMRLTGGEEISYLPVVSSSPAYYKGRYYVAGETYQDPAHNIDVAVQSIDPIFGTATLQIKHEQASGGTGTGGSSTVPGCPIIAGQTRCGSHLLQ